MNINPRLSYMSRNKEFTASHLIALASVARHGSLTAASAALGKTQPAVSAQLKQLNSAVGAPMLSRHRHGVTLTAAGASLLPYAQACVRALEGAGQEIAKLRGLEEGVLRVLASTSVAVYMLPPVLAAFHAKFPKIELRMTRHNAEDAMRALERGAGDIAVVRESAQISSDVGSDFVVRTLFDDETVLAVPPDHRLANRGTLKLTQLDGLEIVAREAGSATRALMEQLAEQAGISFKIKFQTVGVEALKEAVLQGFGAGFISRLAVQREVQSGVLSIARIKAPEVRRRITIAFPAAGLCVPSLPPFVEILQSVQAAQLFERTRLKARTEPKAARNRY